jgi:hypothetical protein
MVVALVDAGLARTTTVPLPSAPPWNGPTTGLVKPR